MIVLDETCGRTVNLIANPLRIHKLDLQPVFHRTNSKKDVARNREGARVGRCQIEHPSLADLEKPSLHSHDLRSCGALRPQPVDAITLGFSCLNLARLNNG